ncbi:hypothetical protein SADFL11_00050700 (plasmid) [Roseibium alexandrii DFL-11]|uniref:Uncharacterized protein n=1 Tax=Roseibium alexandrii (strain DSM 17067 / NCIMB 14079 / DFL-11) TaxID=244592 RepID=A0A5E8UWY4_ROSAD|nr:hypothetical protein SADFL11_00050700 [Roseibium alexandrii DFL-11]
MNIGELLTETRLGGDPEALLLQLLSEGSEGRRGAGLSGREPLPGRRASDISFDPVELGDSAQALGGDLGDIAVEHFLQFPSCVRPALRDAYIIRDLMPADFKYAGRVNSIERTLLCFSWNQHVERPTTEKEVTILSRQPRKHRPY